MLFLPCNNYSSKWTGDMGRKKIGPMVKGCIIGPTWTFLYFKLCIITYCVWTTQLLPHPGHDGVQVVYSKILGVVRILFLVSWVLRFKPSNSGPWSSTSLSTISAFMLSISYGGKALFGQLYRVGFPHQELLLSSHSIGWWYVVFVYHVGMQQWGARC